MGKIKSFKQEFSFDERRKESECIVVKYPDRVPIIIEKYSRTDLPELDKKKLRLNPGKALFIFVKNTLPQTASLMNSIYESYKDDDGFLYMCYSSEKTFG
ncbi:autophagy-related protein 8i-like isoform X2 [Abrus precatorius]|uniref:Autophagy-related protein n=1 Tax=Abrus precatorius TaxID=3816 RepID=A0A8B8JKD7_ABRPR|nr:autophagy-related protein 8i-like isoform X2 [Abrus precatorius]